MITRRDAIKSIGVSAVSISAGIQLFSGTPLNAEETGQTAAGEFILPPLPYAYDALEPSIDAVTMTIHHDKHHAGYVKKLNAAIAESPSLKDKNIEFLLADIDAIPESVRMAVRNNGGGHYNHSLFWSSLTPNAAALEGPLLASIEKTFGSFDAFKTAMEKGGGSVFGSGWVWLSLDKNKTLIIETTANQDNPISHGNTPLLGIDVWEHAYYLKYQNRRTDYLSTLWNVINWPEITLRYQRGSA